MNHPVSSGKHHWDDPILLKIPTTGRPAVLESKNIAPAAAEIEADLALG